MSRVFISYSAKDRDFILKIASDLQQANHFVWLDVWEITGRKPYWSEIQDGIESCSFFLFAVSPDSIDPEGGASIELHHAAGLKPPRRPVIVPIVVRPTPYEAFPILISPGRLQIHDFTQHPYDLALSRVLKALEPKEEPLPPIPRSVASRPPSVSRHNRQSLLIIGAVIALVLIGVLFALLTSRSSLPGTQTAVAFSNGVPIAIQTATLIPVSNTPASPQSVAAQPTIAVPTDTHLPPTPTATFTSTVDVQATQAVLNRTNTAVAIASFTQTPTSTSRPTQTPLPTATLTHTVDVQATQNARATATASVEQMTAEAFFAQQATIAAQDTATAALRRATGTAFAQSVATTVAQQASGTAIHQVTLSAQQTRIAAPPTPTTAPTRNTVEATAAYLTRSAIRVFGPTSGSLLHSSSNYVTKKSTNINLADFTVEARFYNPYQASATQRWDYGFFFRDEGSGKEYRLRVASDKTWTLDYGIEEGIAVGAINNLDVTQIGFNHLKLIVEGSLAFFYVNNSYVASLDVSRHRSVGAIAVATGIYSGYKMDGRATQYDSFAISTLNAQQATSVAGGNIEPTVVSLKSAATRIYGPIAGRLAHIAKPGYVVVQNSGVNVADFIVEARFYNPYGISSAVGWDYGFLFRDRQGDEQYRIGVTTNSNGTWNFSYGVGDFIAYGSLDNLDMSETGSNYLRLVVKGNTGFFFINNKYIATLDVSQHTQSGDVRIVTGAQSNHQISGKTTRFDSFTIWRLPK